MNKLSDIFDIVYGNGYELINLKKTSEGPNFVARTSKNNGVVGKVLKTNTEPFENGLITVSLGGSVLEAFLQDEPFYTAFHIYVLKPKKQMNNIEKLFYCMCINLNKYRYNYGRQANRTLGQIIVPDFSNDFNFDEATKSTIINYQNEINSIEKYPFKK